MSACTQRTVFSRCGLLAICLAAAQVLLSPVRAEDSPPKLPLPNDIVEMKGLVAKVEATPYLPTEAREEARRYGEILEAQFQQGWAPLEKAYAQRQRDLAVWEQKKRRLSQRNAAHLAQPHQFKPEQAAESAAYNKEAGQITSDMTALNEELAKMNLAWRETYGALSKPVGEWLHQPVLVEFTKTLQGLIDGRITFGSGVIDPRNLITPDLYKSAKDELSKLESQKQKLGAELEKVLGWKKGLNKDVEEFEAMRQEAQRDLVFEFLDHVPVVEGLELCKDKNILTAAKAAKIEAGYDALKGLINEGRGITDTEDSEKFKQIMEGNRSLTEAMQAIPKGTMTKKQKAWLDGFSKVYGASVSAIAGTMKETKGQGRFETVGNVLIDVGEAVVPVAGMPVLAMHLVVRRKENWAATTALASLADARTINWDAERFLTGKLERLNTNYAEVKREVDGYENLQAERKLKLIKQ